MADVDILNRLTSLAQFCQDETLRPRPSCTWLEVVPEGIQIRCRVVKAQSYEKRHIIATRNIASCDTTTLERIVLHIMDEVEYAAARGA